MRMWTEEQIRETASKFKCRSHFMDYEYGMYCSAKTLGILGNLEFAQETWTEDRIREVASHFKCKSHFMEHEYGAYREAKNLGILNDLEFAVSRERTQEKALYITNLTLTTGEIAVMFGIAGRHPGIRYRLGDLAFMTNRGFYVFVQGKHAVIIENHLKSKFRHLSVMKGESPLVEKKGTNGEILKGIPLGTIQREIEQVCPIVLPKLEPW